MFAGTGELVAARTGDARWREILPPLVPLDGIAVRALADTLDSGSTYGCACNKAKEKRWTGRFRNGGFAQTGSLEA